MPAFSSLRMFSMGEFNQSIVPSSMLRTTPTFRLGAYHNYTDVTKNAYYAGSTERLSFAEAGKARGSFSWTWQRISGSLKRSLVTNPSAADRCSGDWTQSAFALRSPHCCNRWTSMESWSACRSSAFLRAYISRSIFIGCGRSPHRHCTSSQSFHLFRPRIIQCSAILGQ